MRELLNIKKDKVENFTKAFNEPIKEKLNKVNLVVFVCIGTDAVIADSLGPIIGTKLTPYEKWTVSVYGTLHDPITAKNANNYAKFPDDTLVVAIDATIHDMEPGSIIVAEESLKPGEEAGADLKEIGDVVIKGVVSNKKNIDNVRLSFIMDFADYITEGILASNIFKN